MTRVVIAFGGFRLSPVAEERLRALGWNGNTRFDLPRDDPRLLQVVDEMGQSARDKWVYLRVVDVPDDVAWHIEECEGSEWVAEDHRTWGNG